MFSHVKPMADNDAPGANLDPRVTIGRNYEGTY